MYSLAVVAAILFSVTSVAAVDNTNDTVAAAAADGGGGDTKLSARVRATLSKLTTLSDGGPNPRVTCTDGLWEAGEFIYASHIPGLGVCSTIESHLTHTSHANTWAS